MFGLCRNPQQDKLFNLDVHVGESFKIYKKFHLINIILLLRGRLNESNVTESWYR